MSRERIRRNLDIFSRRRSGETYEDLANYYHLSTTRIRDIYQRELMRSRNPGADILEIKIACEDMHVTKLTQGRIQNALKKARLDKQNKWRRLSRDDILKIPNLGPHSADIIEYAQKLNYERFYHEL